MSVIHPARRTAAGGLPLPYVDIAAVLHREMKAAARHRDRRFGDSLGTCMESAVACKACIRSGQHDRKFILIVLVLVPALEAVVKQVPSIDFFHERQLLQRSSWILPCEEKIRPSAVVH